VRQEGQVRDAAVLIAKGVGRDGKRRILGVSVALSEHEAHWRTFLQGLLTRGLQGVELIISDDHAGLGAARKAVFGGLPWQRCQFHLQLNASAYVPRQELRAIVAAELRAVFNAPTRLEAERALAQMVETYTKTAPRLATWLEANIGDGLTVFTFPTAQWRLLRTTNGLERFNRELKRRTRVVGIVPNVASCLRLVSAVAMEISDEWEAGRSYLPLSR
jgi:putative transposase